MRESFAENCGFDFESKTEDIRSKGLRYLDDGIYFATRAFTEDWTNLRLHVDSGVMRSGMIGAHLLHESGKVGMEARECYQVFALLIFQSWMMAIQFASICNSYIFQG